MTNNQFERLCERAQKYGSVKTPSGGELVYWGRGEYSVIDPYGNVVRCGLKSEIRHIYVD